jgi:hypothetical protein
MGGDMQHFSEVIELWSNFGIDLSLGVPEVVEGVFDPCVISATSYLGNTWCDHDCVSFPYGATHDPNLQPGVYELLGALHAVSAGPVTGTWYVGQGDGQTVAPDSTGAQFGHYIVASPAPRPSGSSAPACWG